MTNTCKKKIILIFLFIVSFIYVLTYLRPSVTNFDENFTLALIHHTYSKMIYLDTLDVHPPLYYIFLKFFINITTFWTTSIPIKIIFARLFSLIASIISFIFLCKIVSLVHIHNNLIIQWASFILLPGVLGLKFPFQQLVDIRMYSLAGMFLVIEFYYLIRFINTNKNKLLLLSVLFAILSAYTHYYSAIFSGLLIFAYFIFTILNKRYVQAILLFISGMIYGLSFIPWIKILFKQIKRPGTYWMTSKIELKELVLFLIIIIIFIYPLLKYVNTTQNTIFKNQFYIILIILSVVFIISISYSIIRHPIFQVRYMYPILLIYEFLGINVLIKQVRECKISSIFIVSLLIIISLGSGIYQIVYFDANAVESVNTYRSWSNTSSREVRIPYKRNKFYDVYIPYVYNMHRNFIAPKSFKNGSHIYNGSLYRKIFSKAIKKIKIK